MKRIPLIIFLIFCFSTISIAENFFRFQNITIKEGLSQNTVRCIMQDDLGFIWIGTLNGLNRYDGTEFVIKLPEYGTNTSLSDNRIKKIHEDKFGYIWVQTNIDNINCYDIRQERFINFHPYSTNHTDIYFSKSGDVWLWGKNSGCLQVNHTGNSLESNYFGRDLLESKTVNFVTEGSDSTIWIGTNNNVFSYRNKELTVRAENFDFKSAVESGEYLYVFTNNNRILIINQNNKNEITEIRTNRPEKMSKLHDVAVLSEDKILITSNAESYIFNTQSLKIQSIKAFSGGNTLKNAYIYYDNRHNLWLFNKSGSLWQLNKRDLTFKEIKLIPPSILSYIDLERYSVYHDSRNIIWITTYGNGLFVLDENTGNITHIKHDKNQTTGLKTNFLLSITEDKSGEIWVGTEYAGILKISLTNNRNTIFYPEGEKSGDEDKIIRLIHEDKNENLWIGTKKGNLYIFDKNYNQIIKHEINGGMPYTLTSDTAGNMWVGTKGKGLLIFKKEEFNKFEVYNLLQSKVSPQSNNNLYSVCSDIKGRIWLGTFGSGLLLTEKDGKDLTFRNFPEINKLHDRIRTIEQDKEGLIWVGGNSGVFVFNPEELIKDEQQFISFRFDSKNNKSINNNEVKIIYMDSRGIIWLGTSGGGINQVMKGQNITDTWFKHYTSEDGLINNIVQGIVEDNSGNLWISTENGISKFDFNTKRFENYNFSDNWKGDLFCESAVCKQKNGNILFGSQNGMYKMSPDSMSNIDYSPPVMITGLKINGNNVLPGNTDSPLMEAIYKVKKINLRYDQNSFNLQFAILNFRNPAANSFTYILEGYEKVWNPATRHNFAAYRNIPSGKYIFKVKGCNSLGIWNDNETILEITVVPPFWRSPLAFAIYILLFLLSMFIAIKTIRKINNLNSAVKVEQQISEFKLRFFTNISHEFRSPLTIIRGTIENLISRENIPAEAKKQIGFLEKSSLRLLRLINQILEFRQLQNNKLELILEQTEVVEFFKDIFSAFEELADRKNIRYNFKSSHNSWNMLLDQSKMDKVVYNLISNAFKFVPQNGRIDFSLTIDKKNEKLTLTVSDNGIGISKDKQALIFVRFAQINPSQAGTGIGLHLASELVKTHKGTILYKDSTGGGACFVVEIPFSDTSYEPREIARAKKEKLPLETEFNDIKICPTYKQKHKKNGQKYKLLIIEDDPEINEFLQTQLCEYFEVSSAEDGIEGLNKCIDVQPDLIVSDVMMPKMNGFEVTQRIKSEFRTSHIPIILLTAYASIEHQVEGIESGADSYITKPFSIKYLLTRIIKLIEQREKLQQKFAREPGLIKMPVFTVDKDNEFIKKTHEIIEKNIDNEDFSVDTFASLAGMGRTIFYKKVKGLTGYTPSEYLRVIRMKKAAELLTSTNFNVSEVAYKVGINNPFYFSKCFKKQFGITPSQFAVKGTSE